VLYNMLLLFELLNSVYVKISILLTLNAVLCKIYVQEIIIYKN